MSSWPVDSVITPSVGSPNIKVSPHVGPTLIIIIGSTGRGTNHRDQYLLDKWVK